MALRERNYHHRYGCPVEATLDIISGKYKGVILFYLLQGTMRFGELRRLLPYVTQRILTHQLRELENDGIVKRTIYAEIPPKVEYSLTDSGRSLKPLLVLMRDWGDQYLEQVQQTEGSEKNAA
ncbi:MAG: helix-turn-helix transcriptional regulator [Chloroflexi bacterium AL-W]|nr:helix-turn-helix transcriptional regulator [Chloroflexi bacterium AL-N1]NOK67068.1 helix-turn-helix transcriptional regulator [Chloroflexi bacterium AL-N10]NOK74640.1 helix-turn-helix transcriptional regulator [Chloroflexi bacterium AL-N5]NOK81670.1 helix-turn-helix transcriptional regulator [Chloroflexi bacterium AL-W]NOK89140.1 helix-turn-helix transcriptional regulator [Chloroflexi bacterium AL-N15]